MQFPSFYDTNYEKAPKVYLTDHLIAFLFGWMIPRSVTPNVITFVRMLATPCVLLFLFSGSFSIAVPFFILIAFTDALDGALARTRNMITPWGKMFDPFADKMLVIPVLLFLLFSSLDIYLVLTVVGVEIAIVCAALIWKKQGRIVQANVWGKIKMILEIAGMVAILFTLWLGWPLVALASILIGASVFFAIMSLVRYGA